MADVKAILEAAVRRAGSARELARRAGVSPSYVSLVRSGKTAVGRKLAAYLGVDVVVEYRRTK